MKIERDTIKYEIGNFMISMKYYIAKRRRRYFISWDTSKAEVMIYIQMKRERETIKTEIGNFMMSMKYCIAKQKKTIFRDIRYIKININDIYIYRRRKRGGDDLIWDWQFHDINEILYRHKKKTILHMMRYIQYRKNDTYIYI